MASKVVATNFENVDCCDVSAEDDVVLSLLTVLVFRDFFLVIELFRTAHVSRREVCVSTLVIPVEL